MSETATHVAEASASAFGFKSMLGGSATSATAFFMGINWIGWLSLGVGILGLIINFYFSWQRNKREKEVHKLTIKKLNRGQNIKGENS